MKKFLTLIISAVLLVSCATIDSKEGAKQYAELQIESDKFDDTQSAETKPINVYMSIPNALSLGSKVRTNLEMSIKKDKSDTEEIYLLRFLLKREGTDISWFFPRQGNSLVLLVDGKKHELEFLTRFSGDVDHNAIGEMVMDEQFMYIANKQLVSELANFQTAVEFKLLGNEDRIVSTSETQTKLTTSMAYPGDYLKYMIQASAEKILQF